MFVPERRGTVLSLSASSNLQSSGSSAVLAGPLALPVAAGGGQPLLAATAARRRGGRLTPYYIPLLAARDAPSPCYGPTCITSFDLAPLLFLLACTGGWGLFSSHGLAVGPRVPSPTYGAWPGALCCYPCWVRNCSRLTPYPTDGLAASFSSPLCPTHPAFSGGCSSSVPLCRCIEVLLRGRGRDSVPGGGVLQWWCCLECFLLPRDGLHYCGL